MLNPQREGTREATTEGAGGGARLVPDSAPPTTFSVIASGSTGNCSVLIRGEGQRRRVTLIDAGLSPLRTKRFLLDQGIGIERIDDVLLTHLDTDHFHRGWIKALPGHARFRIHHSHRGRAQRAGLLQRRTYVFNGEPFDLPGGVTASARLLDHDDTGVAVFRFRFADAERSALGYATDVGRPTVALVEALAGVDVLAIESNYCPHLQAGSSRPEFLKRRITGGSGHLSNEECRSAVSAIAPRREVVLLHLSRDCNTPRLASRYHEGAGYGLTVSSPAEPTPPIRVVTRPIGS